MFMCYILTYFILSYYHIPIILHCYLEYIRLILPSKRFLYLKKGAKKKEKKAPLEKGMATHSNILAKIPWTQEPGRLPGVAKSQTRLSN